MAEAKQAAAVATAMAQVEQVDCRIWVVSWNMQCGDMEREQGSAQSLASLIPDEAQVVVVGLQESAGEQFHMILDGLLSAGGRGFTRLAVGGAVKREQSRSEQQAGNVHGRGDGGLLTGKLTSVAVWVQSELRESVTVQNVKPLDFGRREGSKGAATMLLRAFDSTIALVNCHLSAAALDKRMAQYGAVVEKVATTLVPLPAPLPAAVLLLSRLLLLLTLAWLVYVCRWATRWATSTSS